MADTRAGFWLLVVDRPAHGAVAVIAGLVLDDDDQNLLNILAVTVQPASILMPVVGILLVTSEWSQRTAMITFALVPGRLRVLGRSCSPASCSSSPPSRCASSSP